MISFKDIAVIYIPFMFLFSGIAITTDEIFAKSIAATFILLIITCVIMDSMERRNVQNV